MTDTLIAPRGSHLADTQAPQPAPTLTAEGTRTAHSADRARVGWKRRLVRIGILAVVVAGIAVAAVVLPLRQIADAVVAIGPAAAVAIAVVGGLLLSVLVPRTAITLACGALLGPATGAATALAAAVIAAIATYYAGHWTGRGALTGRGGGRFARRLGRLDGWLNRRGLSAVLLVRLLPLAPFGLVGYAYGTTSVCRKRYLLGTTIASIPSAVTYAVIGAAVTRPGQLNPLTLAPALIGLALTTAIVIRWRRTARRTPA